MTTIFRSFGSLVRSPTRRRSVVASSTTASSQSACADDVLQLPVGHVDADGHVDAAAAEDGEVRDEPAGVVLREDGRVRLRGEAHGDQPRAELLHAAVELGVGDGLETAIGAARLQGGERRVLDDRFLEQPDEGGSHYSRKGNGEHPGCQHAQRWYATRVASVGRCAAGYGRCATGYGRCASRIRPLREPDTAAARAGYGRCASRIRPLREPDTAAARAGYGRCASRIRPLREPDTAAGFTRDSFDGIISV